MAGIRTDFKTGEQYQLKVAENVVDKKTGSVLPIAKTYFEVGSKLFKIEISDCKKETKNGRGGFWVKITEKKKQSGNTGYKRSF